MGSDVCADVCAYTSRILCVNVRILCIMLSVDLDVHNILIVQLFIGGTGGGTGIVVFLEKYNLWGNEKWFHSLGTAVHTYLHLYERDAIMHVKITLTSKLIYGIS